VTLVSVAKGSDRKVGMEQIFFPSEAIAKRLDEDSPALDLIQAIRDEAHRFAITGHRGKRDKKRRTSTLEGITGVGAKRRRAIIQHFGALFFVFDKFSPQFQPRYGRAQIMGNRRQHVGAVFHKSLQPVLHLIKSLGRTEHFTGAAFIQFWRIKVQP
ncbi:MAG: hypothetical protein COB46_09730, partial [Rhodospirillaceae bacterium]